MGSEPAILADRHMPFRTQLGFQRRMATEIFYYIFSVLPFSILKPKRTGEEKILLRGTARGEKTVEKEKVKRKRSG